MSEHGKKFDAAEKHFEKKRVQLDRKIKDLTEQRDNFYKLMNDYKGKFELLERENEELKNWIERLLEYTELTQDDIKAACEKDKQMASAMKWMTEWSNTFQKYM
jgi:chromosome segregation ATPase